MDNGKGMYVPGQDRETRIDRLYEFLVRMFITITIISGIIGVGLIGYLLTKKIHEEGIPVKVIGEVKCVE